MEVREGEGWRLVHDPGRSPFCVLIGGGEPRQGAWAAELTAVEAGALRDGVQRLAAQHQVLEDQLMEEEAIDLELETTWEGGSLWLALEGDRRQWRLRFVLTPANGHRAVEGSWGAGASRALAAALASLEPAGEAAAGAPA
jgi:hypothetical protein